ncbi:MAG TPA: ribonuclease HII [Bacillales bacterium]|nr:ribonuclease HII [Bacillales bacterium]
MRKTIREIKERLYEETASMSEEEIKKLQQDERKGVQQLLATWQKQQRKRMDQKKKYIEMSTYENQIWQQGSPLVAGVDEAGRGPLAGPVVAGAVILNKEISLIGLNDSKQLTETIRETLFEEIYHKAEAVGVGIVSAPEIDRLNIYQAAKRAMVEAIEELGVAPQHVLADAMELPISMPQTSIVKGDSRSVSIAAGSIVAKVTRDRLMRELHKTYPKYGFSRHFGYATAEHLKNLERYGACEAHRRSFAPVRERVRMEVKGSSPEVG